MTTHHLHIDAWHPARLNELLNAHWSQRGRRKREDRDIIAAESLAQGIPRAAGRRRVELAITLAPRQRAADPDAYWKSLLDGMVKAGLLTDDNRQGCELGSVRFARGARRATEIIITDIGEECAV